MNLRSILSTPDDTTQEYIPIMFDGSVEPMRRADHRAKKHGRPQPVRYRREKNPALAAPAPAGTNK